MHRADGADRPGAEAAEVAARLVVLGSGGATIVALGHERVTVGRDPDNGVVLEGPDVSRRHCALEPQPGGGHAVVDLGSTNGVLVNDRRVTRVGLERFDRLRVGEHDLVYLDGETDAARVMDLLRPPDTSTATDDDADPGCLRDRLLWLILMTQELRCEEDTNAVLDTLLEELLRWTRYERVLLVLEGGDTLEVGRARNLEPKHLQPEALLACRPLVAEALRRGRAIVGASPLSPELGTLCVPIMDRAWAGSERRRSYAGQVRGALLLGRGERHAPRELEAEDLRLLRALTRQVATLLANARLHRQASTDALTQLSSRACIEQVLRQELEGARSRRQPLAVVLIDVDNFKAINDTLGHHVGDEVLCALGRRITRVLRHDDAAGRWGGEEFLLVLPATDVEGAMTAARKVVSQVAERPVARDVRVTISAGVAVFPAHGVSVESLVRAADRALYVAKDSGKNRAELHTPVEGLRTLTADHSSAATRPMSMLSAATIRAVRVPTPSTLNVVRASDPLTTVAWLQCDLLAPVALSAGATTLGRSDACDIILPHPLVSRRHATVHVAAAGAIELEDHSTNGCAVNGAKLQGRTLLNPGDKVTIGPFQFDVVSEGRGDRSDEQTARLKL